MKSLLILCIFAGVVLGTTAADDNPFLHLRSPLPPTDEMLAVGDADEAYRLTAAMSGMDALMDATAGLQTMDERLTAMRRHIVTLLRRGSAFLALYPEDPRRWRVVQILNGAQREIAGPDGAPREELEGITWDPLEFVSWRDQIVALASAAEQAPDAPPEVKYRAETARPGGLRELSNGARRTLQAGGAVDLAPLQAEIVRLAKTYPEVEALGMQSSAYFLLLDQSGAEKDELIAIARTLLASPNPAVRKAAQAELDKLTAFDQALTLSFTAVDGRPVDLQDYRGKVVLIDFWATWCGPCIREIPKIKDVYARYRDQGFDVIGITLENARLSPQDTPEQREAKLERARQVLNDFTTQHDMPWPQHFDGRFWQNEIAARFGIAGIPAMFLIDQEGRVATTEARGERLESEVRRLLGL